MLFTKSAPVVSRSALAKSKKFWGGGATSSSNQGPVGPGFFVSTPQFTRHQNSQLVSFEDSRGAGSSSDPNGIDNPYLALTAGSNTASGASTLYYDEEKKDETPSKARTNRLGKSKHLIDLSSKGSRRDPTAEMEDQNLSMLMGNDAKDPVAEAIDQLGERAVVDGMIEKMHRLHEAGSHTAVLATFEVLETIQPAVPLEVYNLVLESLVSTCDITTLLEAYEKMLSRGVRPNEATYCVIINALMDAAQAASSTRLDLVPFLGQPLGILESVDEIKEGLAVEEYLVLCHNILQAFLSTHTSPWGPGIVACMDRVVQVSVRCGLAVPQTIRDACHQDNEAIIAIQPSVHSAALKFSSLSPDKQNSKEAQIAMLRSYFRFSEPSAAIAFYSGCGTPSYLLKPLLVGLAGNRMVGTARRWAEEMNASPETIQDVLEAIPIDNNAADILPSATKLFFRMTGGGGGAAGDGSSGAGADDLAHTVGGSETSSGRCAFIKLCVAAKDDQALFMAIRESRMVGHLWDAITISQTLDYLVEAGQPLLAADICAWQVSKLVKASESKHLKGYVDQEIVSDLIHKLQRKELLSLDAAVRILPMTMRCSEARRSVLDLICVARLSNSHELSKIQSTERAATIASSLAALLINTTHPLTGEELSTLREVFPYYVEDAIALKSEFDLKEALNVEDALKSCETPESLLALWRNSNAISKSLKVSSPAETSLAIQRYAMTPSGIDIAFEMLNDQLRLGRRVSTSAVEAVLAACVSHSAHDMVDALAETLPKTGPHLNALTDAAVKLERSDLVAKCYSAIKTDLGLYPTYDTYLALISHYKHDWEKCWMLYKEATEDARLTSGPDMSNSIITVLADNQRKDEFAETLLSMRQTDLNLSVPAYESILRMYTRINEGERALNMLKQMNITLKSLLSVNVFNQLMDYFVNTVSDRQLALEVFNELRSTGTLATASTYRLLMEAYLLRYEGEKPNLENADQVLKLMRRDGAPITAQCYATLLRARGVLFRDFAGARNFYRGMIKNSRVLPDKGIFTALLESYIINGKQSETSLVLDEMKRYHVPIDDDISHLATTR